MSIVYIVWDEYREWRWVVLHVCKGWNRHTDIFSLHTHRTGFHFEWDTYYILYYTKLNIPNSTPCVYIRIRIYITQFHTHPLFFFRQFLVSSFSNSLVGVFFLRSSRFYYYWSYVWLFGSSLPMQPEHVHWRMGSITLRIIYNIRPSL